ncbi:response regulator [Nitrospira sp. M1]
MSFDTVIQENQHALPWTVLVAEDNPDDCRLTEEAWNEAQLGHEIRFVHDGKELLDYLYNRGSFVDAETAPRPGVILLDLNMPQKSGSEALMEIKTDPALARIPIIILTTSKATQDMLKTSVLGVNGYITKPGTFNGYIQMMHNLAQNWSEMMDLPFSRREPGPSDWLGKTALC